MEHSPADRHRVNLLGGSLVALALFGAIPCVVEVYRVWDADTPTRIGLWFWPTLLLSTVQLAFARYLTQLPDWSSTWITALMSLAAAALYSMLLGAVLIAKPASPLNDLLPLLERGNEVKGWCLIMVSLSSLLTYLSGRLSVRWHRNYQRWVESLAPGDSA